MAKSPRFYFANRPEHKQVQIHNPFVDTKIPVDHRLAGVLELLWDLNECTEASCQGVLKGRHLNSRSHEYLAYIKFTESGAAVAFSIMLAGARVWHYLEAHRPYGCGIVRFKGKDIARIEKALRKTHERIQLTLPSIPL